MGWLRSRTKLGAWLALVALALKLALSFGHHHFGEAEPHHPQPGQQATAPAGHAPDHASDEDKDHAPADRCMTCVVAAAAAITASPAAPPGREATAVPAGAAVAASELRGRERTAFEARAPPRS
jgi:hypothetical protein